MPIQANSTKVFKIKKKEEEVANPLFPIDNKDKNPYQSIKKLIFFLRPIIYDKLKHQSNHMWSVFIEKYWLKQI